MLLSLLLLIVGLALLIGGADLLVRGVSALAAALGVPPLVIGLTVVAFGTSTPELVVNVYSAAKGETSLAFGNIVGSCAINIGFVLALTAILRPIDVQVTVISREIPMMLLAVAGMVILSEDTILAGGAIDVLNRNDGLMLLLLFCVFIYYIALQAMQRKRTDPLLQEIAEEARPAPPKKLAWTQVMLTLIGLMGVGVGGRLTVSSAVDIAQRLGISEAIIGLTLISFGTTLPELTTSILAARRGHADIAIGNVVGSCIYNILCIGGIVATIHPIALPKGGQLDLLVMAGLSAALWPIAMRGPRKITRAEGALLLSAYLAYLAFRTTTARSFG
jgi:cation:H+ antiporter